jgi:hypothetical protein
MFSRFPSAADKRFFVALPSSQGDVIDAPTKEDRDQSNANA